MIERPNISLTGATAPPSVPARSGFFDAPVEHEEGPRKPAPGLSIPSILVRYKILLVASALGCAAAAFLFSRAQTPVYDATVVIEIQDFNGNMLNTGDIDTVARSTGTGDSYFETEIEALSTTSLLDRVWERLKSRDEFTQPIRPGRLDGVKRYLGLSMPVADPRQRGIQMLRSGLQVTAPKNSSRLVRISYSADDPKFAARVANTLAEEFIGQNTEMRLDATRRTSSWLTQEIEDLRIRLQSSEKALTNFGDAAGLVFTGDKESVAESRLRQVQDELSKAQADRIVKQARSEIVDHGGTEALGALFDGGPLREYQLKLSDAKQRLAEAEAMYTANHPKVQQARADLTVLESSIDGEVRNVSQRTTADFQSARRREQLLATAFSDQSRAVTAQENQSAHYMLMKNEVETNRQLYDSMLQKVKSLNMTSALESRNILIADPAEPPVAPSRPQPALSSVVGLITGFLLAGVFVLARERSKQAIDAPGSAWALTSVPELGCIPSARKEDFREANSLSLLTGPSEYADRLELITTRNNTSPITDSYRAVVASLLFSEGRDSDERSFAITSSMPGEGKTTAVCNLAVVLTRIDRRVLVIDSDFRRPRLSEIFGMSEAHGLADLLRSDELLTPRSLAAFAHPTAIPKISVLPVGTHSAADIDLLHSARLPEILKSAKAAYDYVLIDTPPVLPVADARIIAQHVDGVVLICRSAVTRSDQLRTATQRLRSDGTRVIGTILNDFAGGGNYYRGSYYHPK